MTDRDGGSGGILRLRHLTMIEKIRRAEDPTWRQRLERQEVMAKLGRMFGRARSRSRRCIIKPRRPRRSRDRRLRPGNLQGSEKPEG
jgi:hypothetical protein